jgi:murein L,D-transpeptidase YcbB/YkuD
MHMRGTDVVAVLRSLLLALLLVLALPFAGTCISVSSQAATRDDISAELRVQAHGRIERFYVARQYQPLWISGDKIGPQAQTLIDYLLSAELDGLKPAKYKIGRLQEAVAAANSTEAKTIARAELLLSESFAKYMADLRKPSRFKKIYRNSILKPKKLKSDALLLTASLPPSFSTYLADMAWMSPHYVRLRSQLTRAKAEGASAETLDRLQKNLARAAALPGPWTHHVVVDSASGKLWYYQGGKQQGSMRVVVGKPESPTPLLAGQLQYAILNPYWNVPVDLAQKNIAPKIRTGKSLDDMGLEALSDWSATPHRLDPATIDWAAVESGKVEIRLRQFPGKTNAMGKVKFLFPNDLGIYLHDTPERDLMKKENRHFSNGCIRLEDAEQLGKWLLRAPLKTKSKEPEQIVPLPLPVPIYLTYLPAQETKRGLEFLADVYGLDDDNL